MLDMPSTFKLALSLTAASAILIGSMFYKGQPAAQQIEIQQQQTRPMESMADLNHKAAAEPIAGNADKDGDNDRGCSIGPCVTERHAA